MLKLSLLFVSWAAVSGWQFEKGHPIKLNKTSSTELVLAGITGTIFSDSLSLLGTLDNLEVENSTITHIEDGALCATPVKRFSTLESTTFPHLKREHFGDCPTLQALVLLGRGITFDKDTFAGLTNLTLLMIFGHDLKHLTKEHLQNLKSLDVIYIQDCGLETIEPGSFDEMTNLTNIYLQDGRISNIEGVFRNVLPLKTLSLTKNKLTTLPWAEFANLKKLTLLSIKNNSIADADVAVMKKKFPKLEIMT